MTGVSNVSGTSPKYDPADLKYLSDHSRGTGATPASSYMTTDEVAQFLDRAEAAANAFGEMLRATGQQGADGYNYGPPPTAPDAFAEQQRVIGSVQSSVDWLNSSSDRLSKGSLDLIASSGFGINVADHVAKLLALNELMKKSIQENTAYATAHLGLSGQLATQDSDGTYRMGAFAMVTQGSDFTMRTGSNGISQIDRGTGVFTTYSTVSNLAAANPPLDVTL